MIDIDAPEDVAAAAARVADAVRAAVRQSAATVDQLVLPDAGGCCLDVAGAGCVGWIRSAFEGAFGNHENDAVATHREVVRVLDQLIETDIAAGGVVRRSSAG
ncbi:hypothetical protein [Nocardia colli]|uniref:hypothetical protein n=1 Tax=Nocardia colli TaxID=2545717 RepID=UPI0035D740AD